MASTIGSGNQKDQKSKRWLVVVILILLASNGYLLWQFSNKKTELFETQTVLSVTSSAKDSLYTELQQVEAEYEKSKQDNLNLQDQLSAKDEEIKAKMKEIQRLISLGGPAQIAKAKSELAKLKELNKVYLAQIDSLNQVNAALHEQNVVLDSNLHQEKAKTENLTQVNTKLSDKVAIGSVLKAGTIIVTGAKFKSNGKEVVTLKAKAVQKIKISCVIQENRVTDPGNKDIYIRIIGPDGAALSGGGTETFKFNGQETSYTSKKTINYENKETPFVEYWEKGSPYAKGSYTVELYADGNQIGKGMIVFK